MGKKQAVDTGSGPSLPRGMSGALRAALVHGGANLALISLPGRYVESEAMRALKRGLNVFIFSDNVPLAAEVRLKTEAVTRDLLCMGPDCGTAWFSSVGLGFCNEVPRGRIGIVSASGTGLQAVDCMLAARKAMIDPARDIRDCTIVTAVSRNGYEFGIRVSGLGDQWFTAPSPYVKGVYFPGYSKKDANRDIGDSAITESCGLGAFAMAAAPAITQLVGGTPRSATDITLRMSEITETESEVFRIPSLDFRGVPPGADIRKVVETGLEPEIDTGISHKEAGVSQIGAGLTVAPMLCFARAVQAFAQRRRQALAA